MNTDRTDRHDGIGGAAPLRHTGGWHAPNHIGDVMLAVGVRPVLRYTLASIDEWASSANADDVVAVCDAVVMFGNDEHAAGEVIEHRYTDGPIRIWQKRLARQLTQDGLRLVSGVLTRQDLTDGIHTYKLRRCSAAQDRWLTIWTADNTADIEGRLTITTTPPDELPF